MARKRKHFWEEENPAPAEVQPSAEKNVRGGKDEDAIEFDFSKITNLFKGKPQKPTKEEKREIKEEEEYLDVVEFDVSKIGRFLIENKRLTVYFLLLAVFGFSLWVRLLSMDPPPLDAHDPYFNYRYAKMVIDNGMKFPAWDELSYYPPGRGLKWYGFPWMIAWLYQFMHALSPTLTIMASAKYLGALLGALTVIPAFYIGRKAAGEYAGLFASFFVGVNPSILGRTTAGGSDTDGMVLLFSLLVFMFYIIALDAFRDGKFTKKFIGALALGAGSYAFLANSWIESRYLDHIMFPLPFALFGLYLVFGTGDIGERAKAALSRCKYVFIVTLLFIFMCNILAVAPQGPIEMAKAPYYITKDVVSTYMDYARVTTLKAPTGGASERGKMNVYVSVAEMQEPDWGAYTSQLGFLIYLALALFTFGASLVPYRISEKERHPQLTWLLSGAFLAAAVGIFFNPHPIHVDLARFLGVTGLFYGVLALMNKSALISRVSNAFFEDERHINIMLFTFIWSGSLFIVSLMAIRLIMMLAPAVCVAAAVLLDRLVNVLKELWPKASPVFLVLLLLFVAVKMAPMAYAMGGGGRAMTNEQWQDALTWIKENTDRKTTTVSWWDPGHVVTAVTQRRSGADGAHWNVSYRIEDFGFAFATTNETQSVARLQKYLGDSKEMYFISSADLLQKFVWLTYFGTGVKMSYVMLPKQGEYEQEGAKLYVYPISEQVLLVINKKDNQMMPYLYAGGTKQAIKELTYYQDNRIVTATNPEATIEGMVLIAQPDMGLVIYMPAPLNENIMTKTFFFNGIGLKHFELVFQNPSIKLYRVNF